MIEQVARALYGASKEFPDHTWESTDSDTRAYWSDRARAAIGAMREPTRDMSRVGQADLNENIDGAADTAWRAMIDAALEDGK